jgi:hypothetical protein
LDYHHLFLEYPQLEEAEEEDGRQMVRLGVLAVELQQTPQIQQDLELLDKDLMVLYLHQQPAGLTALAAVVGVQVVCP